MSVKVEFFISILTVILYIISCFLLLKLKYHYYPGNENYVGKFNNTSFKLKSIENHLEVEFIASKFNEFDVEDVNLQEMSFILRRMKKTCQKYNLKTPLIKNHFIYNKKHKSLYCWVRKAASTSFTKLFSDMENRNVSRNYYREIKYLAPNNMNTLNLLNNDAGIFKFLVVRHPFERLVSFYRDRIEDNTKYTDQAWIFVPKIFRMTRPALFHSNLTTGNFLKKIFHPDKRLKLIPSFYEFITWFIKKSTRIYDPHWSPYYSHCSVCSINYNFVLKLDDYTLSQVNYLFSKLKLTADDVYLPNLEQSLGGYTNYHKTCEYFTSISQKKILDLYEIYKMDFEMYNYDMSKYMQCTTN